MRDQALDWQHARPDIDFVTWQDVNLAHSGHRREASALYGIARQAMRSGDLARARQALGDACHHRLAAVSLWYLMRDKRRSELGVRKDPAKPKQGIPGFEYGVEVSAGFRRITHWP